MEKKLNNAVVSLIIAVYNADKYLQRCLDSVVKQTYTNLEIILVDDSSTDTSRKICDTYAAHDRRIIVIHQKNAGVSAARNKALAVFKGAYLTFVDADDYIDADMVQTLFANLCRYGVDMVSCCYKKKILLTYCKEDDFKFKDPVIYENEEKLLSDLLTDYLPHIVCAKLFKREVFTASRFAEVKMSEDVLIWLSLYGKLHKAVFLPIIKYYYVIHPDSLMSFNKFNKNMFDDLRVMQQLRTALPQVSKELGDIGERRYIVHILQYFYREAVCDCYADKAKVYQQEVRSNIAHLLANPCITVTTKLRLFLLSIDLHLFYKIYSWYLK